MKKKMKFGNKKLSIPHTYAQIDSWVVLQMKPHLLQVHYVTLSIWNDE